MNVLQKFYSETKGILIGVAWSLIDIAKTAIIIIPIMWVLTKFIAQPIYIPSASMEPTVPVSTIGIAFRLSYKINNPQRGDIVIFYSDEKGEYMCKRIIGLPNETVDVIDGYAYINGTRLAEPYLTETYMAGKSFGSYSVPEDCYFLLGDNRDDSLDSRFWKEPYISKRKIIGPFTQIFSAVMPGGIKENDKQ